MGNLILAIYIVIGICLSIYWWKRHYNEAYEKAKKSNEGVEEGMAVITLLILVFFWPIILIFSRKLWKRK